MVAESVVIHLGTYGVTAGFATSDLWWPKVSYFTWVPKRGGRKCRILHGSLMVAQSAEAYGVGVRFATSDLWWPKVK